MPGWVAAIVIAVLAVVVLRWLVRASEAQLAFFPMRGEDATPATYGVAFTPATVTTSDGVRLRVWHLPKEQALAQVVYFHGNGGNLSIWSDILVALRREGYDVIAFDYRGYGLSTGTPSEAGLYRDVDAVINAVQEQFRQRPIPLIYWGRSLGTAMAAYAATIRPPDGIVLEAGFPSMRTVVRSNPVLWALAWFSSYQFPTAQWMAKTKVPVLVLHGDADSVIPYRLGQELYEQLAGDKRFVTITGGDHNDAAPRDPKTYWGGVATFVADLR
jgi:fermentation-respiration switch protein FrsA (DUF1100 family)